ncbi:NACHT, LRR and PYD domains-containing protein 1b allele 5-like [Fundulus diaphanus]
MLRMEGRGYRPAGPLMDITVFSGKMMEVQLPHWVCIDDVPRLLENFAVLHVNDCGDVLEKVTGVTATHVRIRDPVFSLLAALINYFFPPKITCNTLIYYLPKTPFLKLHIYLIPLDPALKLSIHREETSLGYEVIKKPRPDTPLKMDRVFALKATVETAKIQPPKMTLRHDSQDPNFYEVFIENPDRNFNLELLQTCSEKVWHCEIRKDDHPKSGSFEGGAPSEAAAVKTEGMNFGFLLQLSAAAAYREMARRSIKMLLADSLENLSVQNFQKFCFALVDRRGEPRVSRCRVEGKSRLEVVDVLTSTFTENRAVMVAVELLKDINCNLEAETLEEHFVDQHMDQLVQRVTSIAPILDKLLKAKIMQDETYDEISALPTCQAKMRALYRGPLKAGKRCKDVFYEILEELEPYLIKDLMGK